jgi:mono/diheme cytochrome c family protein
MGLRPLALWMLASQLLVSPHAGEAFVEGTVLEAILKTNQGKIPYPIRNFHEQMLGLGLSGVGISVPLGRSLKKDKSNFHHPRKVVAYGGFRNDAVAPAETPPLFMGYSPGDDNIELIAWNYTLKRYEFFEIHNYGKGKQPQLVAADRSMCISCHQSEGPIFTRAPWAETAASREVADKLIETLASQPADERLYTDSGFGTREVGTFVDAQAIDATVRAANDALVAVNACKNLCGDDLLCRKYFLAAAVVKTPFFSEPAAGIAGLSTELATEFNAKMKGKISEGAFGLPSSVLPDRDPLKNAAQGGTTSVHLGGKPTFPGSTDLRGVDVGYSPKAALTSLTSDEDRAAGFKPVEELGLQREFKDYQTKTIVGLTAEALPTAPRPKVGGLSAEKPFEDLMVAANACFGFSPEQLRMLQSLGAEELKKKIFANAKLDSLLQTNWPPERSKLLAALDVPKTETKNRAPDGFGVLPDPPCIDGRNPFDYLIEAEKSLGPILSQAAALPESPQIQMSADRAKQLLQAKCIACHAPGKMAHFAFDIDRLKNPSRQDLCRVITEVSAGRMPPNSSDSKTIQEDTRVLSEWIRSLGVSCE